MYLETGICKRESKADLSSLPIEILQFFLRDFNTGSGDFGAGNKCHGCLEIMGLKIFGWIGFGEFRGRMEGF